MSRRITALESRHVELGAGLADWNDISVAWNYYTDVDEEHAAVREAAGLFDMSGLRKVHIKGKDAYEMVNYLLPRNMEIIYVGKAGYSLILTKEGGIEDDAIVYRLAEDHYLLVFGTGDTAKQLEHAARGRDVSFWLDDDMHCISLQGPKAVGFLDQHTPMDLMSLKYFHQQETELFGHKLIIARTGYSGERGYDLFVNSKSVCHVWDSILEKGYDEGIRACSFTCLNLIRIEAGLHFYPYDMCTDTSPWEAELGWSISQSPTKGDYLGKEDVMKNRGNQRFYFCGVEVDHDNDEPFGEPIAGGEPVYANGRKAGNMTACIYSNRLKKAIGLAHIQQFAAEVGTPIIVHGNVTVTGKIVPLPFYDPEKKKVRGLT